MARWTRSQVVKRALGEIGNVERPAGSNRTTYGQLYGMDGQPWCAMFVWYLINHGADPIIPKTAYTPTLWNWAKKEDILRKPNHLAKAGDLVLFKFPSLDRINHVGIVVKDRTSASDALVCVEGNTSGTDPRNGGMVAATKRKSYVEGIVDMSGLYTQPPEPIKPKPAPKPKPRVFKLTRLLLVGSKGAEVKALQQELIARGFRDQYGAQLKDDGDFGNKTRHALTEFQDKSNIKVDGKAGKQTAKALGWQWTGK